jgi:hypothetical protein
VTLAPRVSMSLGVRRQPIWLVGVQETVNRASNFAWLKQSACSGLVAVLFTAWVTAPVLNRVPIEAWRATGALVAAAIGAAGVMVTGSWPRNAFAVLTGLLGAGVWLEFVKPHDIGTTHPTFVGLLDTVVSLRDELRLILASAWGGGMLGWLAMRSKRLRRPFGGDV